MICVGLGIGNLGGLALLGWDDGMRWDGIGKERIAMPWDGMGWDRSHDLLTKCQRTGKGDTLRRAFLYSVFIR